MGTEGSRICYNYRDYQTICNAAPPRTGQLISSYTYAHFISLFCSEVRAPLAFAFDQLRNQHAGNNSQGSCCLGASGITRANMYPACNCTPLPASCQGLSGRCHQTPARTQAGTAAAAAAAWPGLRNDQARPAQQVSRIKHVTGQTQSSQDIGAAMLYQHRSW